MSTNLKDYDYYLPKKLIALQPRTRDASRLLTSKGAHTTFKKLLDYIPKNTLFVFNNSMVIPRKLTVQKETGAQGEIFLIEKKNDLWKGFLKIRGKKNFPFFLSVQNEKIEIIKQEEEFFYFKIPEKVFQYLELPLPPYIKRKVTSDDYEFYQTIFAKIPGSLAAPTAGLHFSKSFLAEIQKNYPTIFVTLHVGLGTFLPVKTSSYLDHQMHEESYYVQQEEGEILKNHKGPILCVGTTSLRVVESFFKNLKTNSWEKTNIYFHPYHRPKFVRYLLTNFHLPKTTLLLLVASFLGRKKTLALYEEAIKNNYSFYSYGDAMLCEFEDDISID